MKILIHQNLVTENGGWTELLSQNFPQLYRDIITNFGELEELSEGEACLVFASASAYIDNTSLLDSPSSYFSFVAVGSGPEIQTLQEGGAIFSGFLVTPVEDEELIQFVQEHLLANRPREIDEDFFGDEGPRALSEESMVQDKKQNKSLELDEIELDDGLELSLGDDEESALDLSGSSDDDSELVLDSDIGSELGDIDFGDQSGITMNISASDDLTLDDDSGVLDLSAGDDDAEVQEEDALDLGSEDDTGLQFDTEEESPLDLSDSSSDDESEVDLSFGGLELGSEEEDSGIGEESLAFASPAANLTKKASPVDNSSSIQFEMPGDDEEVEEENLKASPDSTGDFAFELSEADEEEEANETPSIQASTEDDEVELEPAFELTEEEEEEDDEPIGDSLDFTPEEADDEDGTQEFDLSASAEEEEGEEETTDSISIPDDLPEDDIPAPVQEKVNTQTFLNTSAEEGERQLVTHIVREKIDYNFDENEMVRLQVTLRGLKEERDKLLATIEQQKKVIDQLQQDNLGLKAEVEDQKIEITLLKKRFNERNEEASYQVRLSEEKKHLYEEKTKKMQHEFDALNQKVRLDLTRVKQREKELESQLELVKMDADAQIKGRDQLIMELKRKIDSLEFNMENISIREQQLKEERQHVEAKVQKLMTTLKGSMKILEDDFDPLLHEFMSSDKKNEDKL